MKNNKTKNILIVNPFGIGDVLFSAPLVKALRGHFPDGCIGYVCNKRTEPIVSENPNIDEVFVFDKGDYKKLWSRSKTKVIVNFLKLLLKIKKGGFNVLIDLSLGRQYNSLSMLLGIKTRIGFNYRKRGRFLTHKIDIEGYRSGHIVDYYLSLLRFLDVEKPASARLEFFTRPADRGWAKDFLRENDVNGDDLLVGLIPGGGASWGDKADYKHWPEENFSRLIKRIHGEFPAKIIIFGDSSESEKCGRIAARSGVAVLNACGSTTLARFAALLRLCDAVIANDGGPLHVAVSQDTPTVSVFGPVDERVYGPYPRDENHIVIKKDTDCRPCYRKFKIPRCGDRICLKNIPVDDVSSAIKALLSKRRPRRRKTGSTEPRAPVSVVVLAKDEEDNIAGCLESVSWADEIIVVDDFSSDRTCEIAAEYTDRIFKKKMDVEGAHRNWAHKQARNEWILILDADETVSEELRRKIERLMRRDIKFSAFSIPLRNYIGDYWVRHGGWYPAGKVRLFNRNKFRYEETGVHPRVFIDGECGHLKNDIIHKGYPDFGHFLNSLNRQTTLEARKWVMDGRRMSFARALRKSSDRFFKTYILKRGFRDGFIGLMVAFFASLYQVMSYAKYWELRKQAEKKCKRQADAI